MVRNYIKPGEFAKMVGVNKQTLLYYDKIHLFSPEYVDDMGYRYYTFTQLDCFYAIMTLKTIGMSLEEIKEYFDTRDAERTAKLLQKGKSCDLWENIHRAP